MLQQISNRNDWNVFHMTGKNISGKAPFKSQMVLSWNKTWGLVFLCWRTVPGNMLYWLWWNYSDQTNLRPGVKSQSLITAVKTFLEFILRHMSSSLLRELGCLKSCDFVIFRSRTGIQKWKLWQYLTKFCGLKFMNIASFSAHWELLISKVTAVQIFSWLQWQILSM